MDHVIGIVFLVLFILLFIVCLIVYNRKTIADYFTNVTKPRKFKASPSKTKLKKLKANAANAEQETQKKPIITQKPTQTLEITQNLQNLQPKVAVSGPGYFSAAEKWPGCLPRPLYQGSCGSCWGFAAVTALSSRFYIESCGLSGCKSYPQINFGSLNNVYNNLNAVYKFKKIFLTDIFKYIDTNKNNEITKDEFVDTVKLYYDNFNNPESSEQLRHYTAQVLVYILNFQSLGSIDLTNKFEVDERAVEAFDVWLGLVDGSAEGSESSLNLDNLLYLWENEPVSLSAEKIISCCSDCIEVRTTTDKSADNPDLVDIACSGGSLEDAWSSLRETGTPTTMCIGYNLDNWTEGSFVPSCKQIQGPFYSFCTGYNIFRDLTAEVLDKSIEDYEKSGINPVSITGKYKGPWIDPQLFRFRAKNVYTINNNVEEIQREILERGPVTTGFIVYSDFQDDFGTDGMGGQLWKEPSGGEGEGPLGSTKNSLIYKHTPSSNDDDQGFGHAVTIVGWGTYKWTNPKTNETATQANSTTLIPYWICLNSWGSNWGHSGFPSSEDRTKEPMSLSGGGYFWILRGSNECEIEENVVAGQPDIENISYPGIVQKYGWSLPSPHASTVNYLPVRKLDSDPNNVIEYKESVEGGGSYIDLTVKGSSKDPVNIWSLNSMKPASPFTLFWPDERAIFDVALITERVGLEDNEIKVNSTGYLEKIRLHQKNPILILDDEQMTLISLVNDRIIVDRAVNNSDRMEHERGSVLKIMPYRNLNVELLKGIIVS